MTHDDIVKHLRDCGDDEVLQIQEAVTNELGIRLSERQSLIETLEEKDKRLQGVPTEDKERIVWKITDPFSCIDAEKRKIHLCHGDEIALTRHGRNYLDLPVDLNHGEPSSISGYDVFYEGNLHPRHLRISTHFTATAGELLSDEERGELQLEADQPVTRVWLRPS